MKNPAERAQELSFTVVIPDSAFVSNFSMRLGGAEYVAEVAEKAAARQAYKAAAAAGQTAGLVDADTRDANQITVSVSVEPQQKVRFTMVYEELLRRRNGRYELAVHVNPGQLVADFRVDVDVRESLPLLRLRVPELKTSPNDITSPHANPLAVVTHDAAADLNAAHVAFRPSLKQQKEGGANGLQGEFIVEYDVDRAAAKDDIQIIDGYFVHFFAPDTLPTLPKHVIFVLDVSGSMYGEKLDQTKDAMITIIDDMTEQDHFNILTFSDSVYHWTPRQERLREGPHRLTYPGSAAVRDEALSYVLDLATIGGTNINDGVLEALRLAERVKRSEEVPANTQSILVFLTDGEATTGVTNSADIKANVARANLDLDVPIFGLAFGAGADFGLIKAISEENLAFARRIYEGSDAAIQLEDFYLEIASPLLTDVTFNYVGEAVDNASLTTTALGTFNRGKEFVVAGKIGGGDDAADVEILIGGQANAGQYEHRIRLCRPFPIPEPPIALPQAEEAEEEGDVPRMVVDLIRPPLPDECFWPEPPPRRPAEPRSEAQNFIERLWAFLTIKELLDEKPSRTEQRREQLDLEEEEEVAPPVTAAAPAAHESDGLEELVITPPPEKTDRERALELALRYNFVTPVTSLVVVKPNATHNGTTSRSPAELVPVAEAARNNFGGPRFRTGGGGGGCQTCFSLSSAPSFGYSSGGGGGGGAGGAQLQTLFAASGAPPQQRPRYRPRPQSSGQPPRMAGHPPMRVFSAKIPPQRHYSPPRQSQPSAYGDYDDAFEDADSFSRTRGPTTTTTRRTTCQGSISLHDRTYLRGANVTLTADAPDLAAVDFDDSLYSLAVRGDCCWRVFADVGFAGAEILFPAGEYQSPSKIRQLFKKASSVRREPHC